MLCLALLGQYLTNEWMSVLAPHSFLSSCSAHWGLLNASCACLCEQKLLSWGWVRGTDSPTKAEWSLGCETLRRKKTEGMCQRLSISSFLFSCGHLHRLSLDTSRQTPWVLQCDLWHTYPLLLASGLGPMRPDLAGSLVGGGDFCEGWGDLDHSWGLALWDLESSSPLHPEDYWK